MTYKYYDVRRDLNESCSDKSLRGIRSWSEIKKLFKTFHWGMFVLLILLLISIVVITVCPINNLWGIIPMSLIWLCTIIVEYKFDPLLDKTARKNELEKYNDAYTEYINQIQTVLLKNGIDTASKRNLLKKNAI